MCCLQHALIAALPIAKARNNSNNNNKSETNSVAAVGNVWNANRTIKQPRVGQRTGKGAEGAGEVG